MKSRFIIATLLALLFCGCSSSQTTTSTAAVQTMNNTSATELDRSNPLSLETLPLGVDFTQLKSEHFKPALEVGMAQQLKEIEQIVNQTEAPTFENTMIPLEQSGQLLKRASNLFFNATNSDSDDIIRQTETEMVPKLTAHEDSIYLNDKLFARIETIYNNLDTLNLQPEARRLVEVYYKEFVRAGAKLSAEDKAQIMAINAEIADLQTQFAQNLLAEMNDSAVVVDTIEELDGLSEEQIKSAKEAADARGLQGKYLIVLQNTSIQPVLKTANNRALRERVHKASISRGMRGNQYDNRERVLRLVELRAKRARLFGYDSFAAYALGDQMAANVDNVNNMLNALVEPAKASVEREAAELQALIDAQGGGFKLEAWDWFYYAEQLRKQKYAFDENELKPYFELDSVVKNGVFRAAYLLYGLTFEEVENVAFRNKDARVFKVFREESTENNTANPDQKNVFVGYFVVDYYAHDNKYGGAWMTEEISQSRLLRHTPVIENQINVTKPADGEPALLTIDEVTTIFHEFGHALHGLLSDVTYPKLSGTAVPNDFVEFPSQFNETWAMHPDILPNYAVHYKTGEPIPQELVDKVRAAAKFNQGYMTTEYLSATILDQLWHQMTVEQIEALDKSDFEGIENALLDKAGLNLSMVPPRYRTTYFLHIFANGYSAAYYAYIWSEVLDADAEQWFKNHGMSRENGTLLLKKVLSRGNSVDPMTQYRSFTGSDPQIEPLLIRRGLK